MQFLFRLYKSARQPNNAGENRTRIVLMNTILTVFLKGFSILTNFILVPLCLRAVSEKEYGLVLTITSIVNWIAFFDVGLGNGLRNKLGKTFADNDVALGKKYVSTAYFYLAIIFSGVLIIYSIAHPFINWYGLLNLQQTDVANLSSCIYVVIALFVVRFILQLVSVVLLADQKSYLSDAILPIANFLTLGLIFIFFKTGTANFYNLIISVSATPIVVLLIYNLVLFSGRYKQYSPAFSAIDHSLRKGLLSLGYQYFALQIFVLIIFSTSEFLIANLFNVESVTTFNIAWRYYGIVFMLSNLLLAPFWGAFANAWYQQDINWIKKMIRRMHLMNAVLLVMNLGLYLSAGPLMRLWLGKDIMIGNYLAIGLIVYNCQMIFNNVFALFLNGIGKLNMQLLSGGAGALINIPLTIFFARYTNLGLAAVCLANIISLLPGSVLTMIQTYKILKSKSSESKLNLKNHL
jgi:O-antigen/teichoic acid export membrane protein